MLKYLQHTIFYMEKFLQKHRSDPNNAKKYPTNSAIKVAKWNPYAVLFYLAGNYEILKDKCLIIIETNYHKGNYSLVFYQEMWVS